MSHLTAPLLVSAGEPSGRAFADVALQTWHAPVVRAWSATDDDPLALMGLDGLARRGPGLLALYHRTQALIARARPRLALLVGLSEPHAWLGRWLRRRGIKVAWLAPPQIWAWRRRRGRHLAESADALLTLLPFEAPLWRALGADATHVGHPAFMDTAGAARTPRAANPSTLVVLPGSRHGEIERHTAPMLEAARRFASRHPGLVTRLQVPPQLGPLPRYASAPSSLVISRDSDARRALEGADLALAASGTVTLECVAHGALPVVAYRLDPTSALVARVFVKTPYVALPNIVLGRRAFPELLQGDAHAARMADELGALWAARERALGDAAEVRHRLTCTEPFPAAVARVLRRLATAT